MTNKEAIEIIKVSISEVEWNYPLDYAIAFEKAIEILDKAEPKEPVYEKEDKEENVPLCPACNHILDIFDEHCFKCDQRIDWSDW